MATASKPAAKKVTKAASADPFPSFTHLYQPSMDRLSGYISRTLPGDWTDLEIGAIHFKAGHNLLLKGDTSSGKTHFVEALAGHVGKEVFGLDHAVPVYTLVGSVGVTDYDLFGQPATHGGEIVWLHGLVDLAARYGGILYLDEPNLMDPKVTGALHSLLDARGHFVNRAKTVEVIENGERIFVPEVVRRSPNLMVIATYNPGYIGSVEMNQAFLNRFHALQWDYSPEIEATLINAPGLWAFVNKLRQSVESGVLQTPVGTSLIERFHWNIMNTDYLFAQESFLSHFTAEERPVVRKVLEDGFKSQIWEDYGMKAE